MKLIRKVIGPKSKYDKSIPYAYMAKVFIIEDDEDLCRYYYGDTICSLIEHLDNNNISASEVKLYGLFGKEEIFIDSEACTNEENRWLLKPELCRSLEEHYKETLDKNFKGHIEIGECSFEDRDENAIM
jgi:hypothetical protein